MSIVMFNVLEGVAPNSAFDRSSDDGFKIIKKDIEEKTEPPLSLIWAIAFST